MNYDATIRDLQERLSYLERSGAPDYVPWTDYSATSTITGWSAFTTKKILYRANNHRVDVQFSIAGTSNSVLVNFTLPYAMKNDGISLIGPIYCVDNAQQAGPGAFILGAAGSTVSCFTSWFVSGNWTNSGDKEVNGAFSFEMA